MSAISAMSIWVWHERAGSEASDAGATLEQLKDGPKLVSATEATI